MSNYTVADSGIKRLTSRDSSFYINADFVKTARAGFEINQRCPDAYKKVLLDCIACGWIKPVAHVTEQEYLWMNLANDH